MPTGDAFSQIASALSEVRDRINGNPTAEEKKKLDQAYQSLSLALGELALQEYSAAANAVSQAAQQLQLVTNAGLAVSFAQSALLALGVHSQAPQPQSPTAPTGQPQPQAPTDPVAPPPPSPPMGGSGQGQLNEAGIALLKQWEGCVLFAYDDANGHKVQPGEAIHGTLTIGYGHTGADVFPGQTWTEQQAEQNLRTEAAAVAAKIAPLIKTKLSDNKFSAFVCFAFNIGTAGFAGSSALSFANAGNLAGVPQRMALWINTTIDGQHVVSPGLKNRRAAEIALWNTPP